MNRKVAIGLVAILFGAGSAAAAGKVGSARLTHNSFTAVASGSDHPQSIFDCLNQGWKKFGFKNQGQCIAYVVAHQHHSPFPSPPPTPSPTHLPIPTIPPFPPFPPFSFGAQASGATAGPSSSPSPSASPGPSPAPSSSPHATP